MILFEAALLLKIFCQREFHWLEKLPKFGIFAQYPYLDLVPTLFGFGTHILLFWTFSAYKLNFISHCCTNVNFILLTGRWTDQETFIKHSIQILMYREMGIGQKKKIYYYIKINWKNKKCGVSRN